MAGPETNTTRMPDWRWQRSLELSTANRRATRTDDEWVRQGVRYLRRYHRCGNDEQLEQLLFFDPAVHYAFAIQKELPADYRAMVQAMLRTGQPFQAIADNLTTHLDVVTAYERLFYDLEVVLGPSNSRERLPPRLSPVQEAECRLRPFSDAFGLMMLESRCQGCCAELQTQAKSGAINPQTAVQILSYFWAKLAISVKACPRGRLKDRQLREQVLLLLDALRPVTPTDFGNQIQGVHSVLNQLPLPHRALFQASPGVSPLQVAASARYTRGDDMGALWELVDASKTVIGSVLGLPEPATALSPTVDATSTCP